MTILDDIDATIMEILQEKGRTRRDDLAEAVGHFKHTHSHDEILE
jgi:DNA-binding Lrp family transcriptional regulator